MGEIETSGPEAEALLQRLLSNDVPSSRRVGRSTRSCAARTEASSTTCSPTGSPGGRYLTVTNASNHERDLAWFRDHAGELRRRGARRARRLRHARRPGARGPVDRRRARRGRAAAAHAHGEPAGRRAPRRWCAAPATRGRTGSRCCCARSAVATWEALTTPGPPPPGSAPATPCGWRSASTCTETTWTSIATRSRRDWGGAARRRPDSSGRRRSPRPASAAPSRSWRRSCSPAPGFPARATPWSAGARRWGS